MKVNNKVEVFLEYIIAICIVINCNSVWIYMSSTSIDLKTLNLVVTNCFLLILNIISIKSIVKNKKIFLKTLILIIFILVYNIIFIFLNRNNSVSFILKFVLTLICFVIYNSYKFKNEKNNSLLIKISNLIVVFSVISLIFYFTGSVFKIIKPNSQVFYLWGAPRYIPSYYNMYYETNTTNIAGLSIVRNSGMFTESPMHAFNLCIALLIQLFVIRRNNKKRLIILLITILTTLSTTGIIVSSVLVIIYILINKSKKSIYSIIKILTFPIILFISIFLSIYFITDKINSSKYNMGSYSVRMDDFKVGLNAWNDHKIVGNGYTRQDITQSYMDINARGTDIGGSSGLMVVLPEGGIYLLSIYMIPLIVSIVYSIRKKNISVVIMYITITILFIITNIPYTYMMIYFLSLGYSLSLALWKRDSNKTEKIHLR